MKTNTIFFKRPLLLMLCILCFHYITYSQVNNLCAAPTALNQSSLSCTNVAGTLTGSTYTAFTGFCGTSPGRNDVWYSFVAKSQNPTITLSSSPAGRSLQLLTNACPTPVSIQCAINSTTLTASGLTVGVTYLVRVWSESNTTGTFNICISDPALTNNTCATAITITSNTSCINTTGTMYGATNSAPTILAPDCASPVSYDVWYRFVAQTTNPTITLSSIGSEFTNARLQLLSGASCASLTAYFCGNTSINADFLVPGTTYYIRVYSASGTAPTNTVAGAFDLCITDPVALTPFNDECAFAINLPVANRCSSIPGNMAGATPSASIPLAGGCATPLAYDVWYKFTATDPTHTVTLSGVGTNFLTQNMQVFSGTCGSLTSISCGAGLTRNLTGLTVDAIYHIRVYSTTAPAPNGNARFNICVTSPATEVRFGNSYVNISKRNTGGVVQPGDTLEIRMTINHTSFSGNNIMYRLRYVDNLPTKTAMLTGPTDSLRVITNEGLTYKKYTLAGGDDAATYVASPPVGQFNIRMNLGFGSTPGGIPANNTNTESVTSTGSMTANSTAALSDKPRGGGGVLFATAFRVIVTGNVGDTILTNPGQFIYRTTDLGPDIILTATPFRIIISQPLNLCTNSIGINVASEFGGTFGTGSTLSRNTNLTIPIPGYSFISDVNAYNNVQDGRYGIVKNMSPREGTTDNARRQPNCVTTPIAFDDPLNCANRMFGGHWDVLGDHTGTNNAAGNVGPAKNVNAGYMLMVNADYVASEVYKQTINNLCPNTYYEFSSWIKNICKTCGSDSSAVASYTPGVLPNLTYALNDVDYFSTGEVDTTGWLKKGFVFRTGPTQTNATFTIRNNSQGGGGNDWVLDDIAVATCLPTMSYSPTINPTVCRGNTITISDTISSFFRNYTVFKWQRSINNGASWFDVTGVTTLPDTNYYITSYTIPPANTTAADSGNLYRVVVATTIANLTDPNCNISDGVTITLRVQNCEPILSVDLLNFNGKLINNFANLSWETNREDKPYKYIIEKSVDQQNYIPIGSINSKNGSSLINNFYTFLDPTAVNGKASYRIIVTDLSSAKKYSRIVHLNNSSKEFGFGNVPNPFTNQLNFEVISNTTTTVNATLYDLLGNIQKNQMIRVYQGVNSLSFLDTENLPVGVYLLRIENKGTILSKKVIKRD